MTALPRLANLAAGKGGHSQHQKQQQEDEKVEAGRNNAGGQQFQKRDHFEEQVIAIGAAGQDLHHRDKEHQSESRLE